MSVLKLREPRKGTAALEFALTIPLFVVILAGIVELSWMGYRYVNVLTSVTWGCRVGSVIEGDGTSPHPATMFAKSSIESKLNGTMFDCSGGGDCTVTVTNVNTAPLQSLVCKADVLHTPLLLPTDDWEDKHLIAQARARLEVQE